MSISRISLIDEALGRIGASPAGIDDDSGVSNPLALTYETTLADLLGRHPWRFTKVTAQLIQVPEQKHGAWDFAFQLPPEMLGPPLTVWEDRGTDQDLRKLKLYELGDKYLFADKEKVWLTYQRLNAAHLWPGPFRELLILALCMKYSIQVREDRTMFDRYQRQAFGTPQENQRGGQFQVAVTRDSQGEPGPGIEMDDGPLVEARW